MPLMKVLLDMNVLLDWLLKRAPFANEATQVIRLAELKTIELHFAAITLTNAYYIARIPKGVAFATSFVESIRRLGKIVSLDERVIDRALKLSVSDFEDAIQAASAERAGVDFIITRDRSDFVNSPVPRLQPAGHVKHFETR